MQDRLAGAGAFGRACHAAEGYAGVDHHAVFDVQIERSAHGADVVIKTLGDFIGAKKMAGLGARDDDFLDEFAFSLGDHPVVHKVIFQRQRATCSPFA